MVNEFVERQIVDAVKDAMGDVWGDRALRLVRSIGKMAARQGGESAIENYQRLGKKALIGAGVALVAVQVVSSTVGYVVSRKREEQRVEQVVRRVLEEERQREAGAGAGAGAAAAAAVGAGAGAGAE